MGTLPKQKNDYVLCLLFTRTKASLQALTLSQTVLRIFFLTSEPHNLVINTVHQQNKKFYPFIVAVIVPLSISCREKVTSFVCCFTPTMIPPRSSHITKNVLKTFLHFHQANLGTKQMQRKAFARNFLTPDLIVYNYNKRDIVM